MDTTVGTDVDSLFKSVFGNDDFFEIISGKVYDELRSFEVTPWSSSRGGGGGGLAERTVRYEITKYIAFSRQVVQVEQTQVRAPYSRPGRVYAVDTVTRNAGVVYSDYFVIHIHYRLTRDREGSHLPPRTRVEVVAEIEFVKPCLFRGRIESETWGGLKKYYEIMEKEIQTERDLRRRQLQQHQQRQGREEGREESRPREKKGNKKESVGAEDDGTSAKRMRESYNRKKLMKEEGVARGAGAGQHLMSAGGGEDDVGAGVTAGLHPLPSTVAMFLVLLTLFLLTVAVFKMSSVLARLEERLSRLEALVSLEGGAGGRGGGGGGGEFDRRSAQL